MDAEGQDVALEDTQTLKVKTGGGTWVFKSQPDVTIEVRFIIFLSDFFSHTLGMV